MPIRTPLLLLGAAALGFVLGPALDQIHVQTDTLTYAHPWLLEQAWWVAPQFALAFVAIAVGSMTMLGTESNSGAPARPHTRGMSSVVWTTLAFVSAYAVTGIGHRHEWLVVAVLGIALLVRLAVERPDRPALLAIAGLVVGGSAYEWILTSIDGTFDYTVASLGTIPVWLPLLYAYAGFAVVAILRHATTQRVADRAR